MKLSELPRENTTEYLHKLAHIRLAVLSRTFKMNFMSKKWEKVTSWNSS